MKNLNNIIEKINEVEFSFKHINYNVLGKNVRPLIRVSIIKKLNTVCFGQNEKFSFRSYFQHFIDFLRFFELWKMKSKNLFLLYGTDKSGKVVINNRLLDKHFSPFEDKFGHQKVALIEFGYIDPSKPKSSALNITLFYYLVKPILSSYFKIRLAKKIHIISEPLRTNESLDIDFFNHSLIDFFSKLVFFRFILKYILKPKNVFVKSFDNITAMSLVNAANELNINTIEFQHGQQGENSLSYSNWNNTPHSGFKMLPKYFWIWENRFRGKFDRWMLNQNFHKVIVGGNLWHEYLLKINDPSKINFNKKFIHVLYCLQFTELNDIVIKAMKQSKNILWHVRLHPREKHKTKFIFQLLLNKGIERDKFSLTEANKYSFEILVPNIDVVISEWSTVLYEAYCFQKKSITVSNYGKDAYKEFITEGSIYFADKPEILLKLINEKTPFENLYHPKYNHEAVKFLNI